MDIHRREYFIYRIASGKLHYKDGIYLCNPDIDTLYQSCDVYHTCYEKALKCEIYEDADVLDLLISADVWTTQKEEDIVVNFNKDLSDLKVSLYETGSQHSVAYKIILEQIEILNSLISKQYSIRHSLDSFTCEGISLHAKVYFLIKNSAMKNNKKFHWKNHSIEEAMKFTNHHYISEEIIRELCRDNP